MGSGLKGDGSERRNGGHEKVRGDFDEGQLCNFIHIFFTYHCQAGPTPNMSFSSSGSSSATFMVCCDFFFILSIVPMPVIMPYIMFIIMEDVKRKKTTDRHVITRQSWIKTTLNTQLVRGGD